MTRLEIWTWTELALNLTLDWRSLKSLSKEKTYRVIVVCPEENRYKSQPDYAGGVHGEPDILGFIEVWRNLPCLDRVDRAEEDEDHVVDEGGDEGEGGHSAGLDSTVKEWEVTGWLTWHDSHLGWVPWVYMYLTMVPGGSSTSQIMTPTTWHRSSISSVWQSQVYGIRHNKIKRAQPLSGIVWSILREVWVISRPECWLVLNILQAEILERST